MKKVFLLSILFFLPLVLSSGISEEISSCRILNVSGTTYILNRSFIASPISCVISDCCFRIINDSITLDLNGFTVNGTHFSSGDGPFGLLISDVSVNNVHVLNGSLNKFAYGIYVDNVKGSNFTISYITTNDGYSGIALVFANNSIVTHSLANFNDAHGFSFYKSNYNTFFNVSSDYNSYGLFFDHSSYNNITNLSSLGNSLADIYMDSYSLGNIFINMTYDSSEDDTGLSGGADVWRFNEFIPPISQVWDKLIGGGSFSEVLKAYNPIIYEKLGKQWAITFNSVNLNQFMPNLGKVMLLLVQYIFRQPGSLVVGEPI